MLAAFEQWFQVVRHPSFHRKRPHPSIGIGQPWIESEGFSESLVGLLGAALLVEDQGEHRPWISPFFIREPQCHPDRLLGLGKSADLAERLA